MWLGRRSVSSFPNKRDGQHLGATRPAHDNTLHPTNQTQHGAPLATLFSTYTHIHKRKNTIPGRYGKKRKISSRRQGKLHTHGVPALSARTEPKQSKQHQQRRQQRGYKSHATSTRSPCATKRRRHQARKNIDPLPLIQHSHLCSNSKSATNEARLCTPRDRRRSIIECWVNLKNSDLEKR